MFRLLNQHSLVAVTLVLGGVQWWLLRRHRWVRRFGIVATLALAAVLAVVLRTGTGDVRDVADLDRALARERPVALEFFSNY